MDEQEKPAAPAAEQEERAVVVSEGDTVLIRCRSTGEEAQGTVERVWSDRAARVVCGAQTIDNVAIGEEDEHMSHVLVSVTDQPKE